MFHGFWHDVIDDFGVFLTQFAFTHKQALFTHTVMVFFFKALVTKNHGNQLFLALSPISTPLFYTKPTDHGLF